MNWVNYMTDEMYQKLNFYLNGIFKELEVNDTFLIKNLLPLTLLGSDLLALTRNYDLKSPEMHANLSYNEVYLLARQVIETIDKNYLKYYDKLIESGELDFDYEEKYDGSGCTHFFDTGKNIINIHRKFNYIDVSTLVHEFMHYTNALTKEVSINRHILTEAISIYFEEYAKRNLLGKGIDQSELWLNERLYLTSRCIKSFQNYNLILLAYSKFGNIDENSYQMLSDFFIQISKSDFETMCINALQLLDKRSDEVDFEIKMEYGCIPDNYEQIRFSRLVRLVNVGYKYIFGTVVAYYALQHSTLEKMVYLNNHINDAKNVNFNDALKLIDIDLSELSLDPIKEFLDRKGKTK